MSCLRDASSGKEIYLLGTAHISKLSAEEAGELIRTVKPSCVMVELCRERADALMKGSSSEDMTRAWAQDIFLGNKAQTGLPDPTQLFGV